MWLTEENTTILVPMSSETTKRTDISTMYWNCCGCDRTAHYEKVKCLNVILQNSIEMYQPIMHVVACAVDLKEVAMDTISRQVMVNFQMVSV